MDATLVVAASERHSRPSCATRSMPTWAFRPLPMCSGSSTQASARSQISKTRPDARLGADASGASDCVADLLLDTDVFIDVLRGARRLTVSGHRIAYSVVTRAELFSGLAKDEEEVRIVLSPFRELNVAATIP